MQIVDCQQNSPEWYAARAGLPTASQFKVILANGRGGGESKTRKSYLHRLAAEILTGKPLESYANQAMQRGHEMEPEARNFYSFLRDVEPQQVGFIRNDVAGCSPDSLIGDSGVLEIKTQRGDLLIETLMKDRFPPEHKSQVQGQLWITQREWCDLVVYWPGLPTFITREFRDEKYISDLAAAVDQFNAELAEIVERICAYGGLSVPETESKPPNLVAAANA